LIYIFLAAIDQELNDKKRLATSGANFARAYTVEFGSCKFPYNFTGCQDLAKQKVLRSEQTHTSLIT
jgi:photosystem I subunit PsaN